MKKVHVPRFTSDLWKSFQLNILSTFAEEIDKKPFRIYVMPPDFKNISDRQQLLTVNDLVSFLEAYAANFMVRRPQLYVWNEEGSTPDKPPREMINELETLSRVTRNTTQSYLCKERDSNVCIFCGYTDEAKRDAAHILEIHYFKGILTQAERDILLESCGLESINSLANLISLCKKCHRQFDDNNLGIEPDSKTLVVAEAILDEKFVAQGSVPFARLQGKVIKFNGIKTWQPSTDLLRHRFNLFVQGGATEFDLSELDIHDEDN
jgi:ribosomal protein L37AE/L43A